MTTLKMKKSKQDFSTEKRSTDVITPTQRSRCMSHMRGKDTGPEMLLRRALWKKGLRYHLHYNVLGKPDVAFPGKKVAVFVDGCFWRGCPEHGTSPKTNSKFWSDKIEKNIKRDKLVTVELEAQGWIVFRRPSFLKRKS